VDNHISLVTIFNKFWILHLFETEQYLRYQKSQHLNYEINLENSGLLSYKSE
jgi:hypothetical protein